MFRQFYLSCLQNNFSVLELFVVLSQFFQELRRIFQPARMAEKSNRFVSLDKPIDMIIKEQKNNNTLCKHEEMLVF